VQKQLTKQTKLIAALKQHYERYHAGDLAVLKELYEYHAQNCVRAAELTVDPGRREEYLSHTARRRLLFSITRAPCRKVMGVPGQRSQVARKRRGPPVGTSSSLQRKSPAQGGALVTHSLLTRRLISVATQGVGVGHAHIAASHRAGSGVPFIRLGRVVRFAPITEVLVGLDIGRSEAST